MNKMEELRKLFIEAVLSEMKQANNEIYSYNNVQIIKDNEFKSSDGFDSLWKEYKNIVLKSCPYSNIENKDLSKVKILKVVNHSNTIGFIGFSADVDSCIITPFVKDVNLIKSFMSHLNTDILEKIGIRRKVETLYFDAFNQPEYENILNKFAKFSGVEFFKEIKHDVEKSDNDLLFSKYVGEDIYDYIFEPNGLDDELRSFDEAFFYEEMKYLGDTESKYESKGQFDYLIKIRLRHKDNTMANIGFVGLKENQNCLTLNPYIIPSQRKKGLYSYFVKNFYKVNKRLQFKQDYLTAYVHSKNKNSLVAHERLFNKISFKTYEKDI